MTGDYNLRRFVEAQHDCYAQVLAELKAGHKRTHWMWFIFPQMAGLGLSGMSQRYAIHSLDEARAYLHHPLLGPRLLECVQTLAAVEGRSARQIFGEIDAIKLRSSLTLFARAFGGDGGPFAALLARYCNGEEDPATLRLLQTRSDSH